MKIKIILISLFLLTFTTVIAQWDPGGSTSPREQLEHMTGQKIQTYGNNSSYENTTYYQPSQEEQDKSFKDSYSREALKRNKKGVEAAKNGDWDDAVDYFEDAVKLSDDPIFRENLKKALRQQSLKKEKDTPPELTTYQKDFIKIYNSDKVEYNAQLRKLEKIKSKVPPLGFNEKKVVASGFMLGIRNPESDYSSESTNLKDPKTGKPYKEGEFFSGTDNKKILSELWRGLRDSWQIGEYTLSTEYGQNLVRRLNGTHFETFIAHSNGATITEALIRTGHIKVDELNIIGGDRSLMNIDGYDELTEKYGVKKIVVWVNPGDIVPFGTSALKMYKTGYGYNKEYEKTFYDYVNHSLLGSGKTNPKVEYRIMIGPEYTICGLSYLDLSAHDKDCYFENMKIYWDKHGKK